MTAKLYLEGHTFNNENEYRRYRGLVQLLKEGRIKNLQVNPEYELRVNDCYIAKYAPTFLFFDEARQTHRYIQIMPRSINPALEIKIRLFEVLYQLTVERWG
jgi:hypothetical protein